MLAGSGVGYSTSTAGNKPVTDYFSFEWRLDKWPFGIWGNYGTGVWGAQENIDPFFGHAYDRIYGLGLTYNITRNTTWDINYIATRAYEDKFLASDLGSYDEIRTVFSHRFGYIFQFKDTGKLGAK
jgi:hypothetical protein